MEWLNLSAKTSNPCAEIKIGPTKSYTFSTLDIPVYYTIGAAYVPWVPHFDAGYVVNDMINDELLACSHCGIQPGTFVEVQTTSPSCNGLAEYVGYGGASVWKGSTTHFARVQILNGGSRHNSIVHVVCNNLKRL